MSNTVDYYDSSEVGAPTLNNAAGSLDAVLYTCGVTGFRVLTLDNISVAGGVATASYSGGHGYSDKRVVQISGAAVAALNGRKRITVTGTGTFTFAAPGVSDTPTVAGAQAKRAPLGWARPLSAGNVSIYTRTDAQATAMALRVDDSGAGAAGSTHARWRMVEAYADLATFSGAAPGASIYDGAGGYLPKGPNSADAKKWVLVGDGRTLYLFTETAGWPAASFSGALHGPWAMGDIDSFRPGDAYGCLLATASEATSPSWQTLGSAQALGVEPSSDQLLLARPFNGVGGAVRTHVVGPSNAGRIGGFGPIYPSGVDNGVVIAGPMLLAERASAFGHPFRGTLRGMGMPLANIPGGALHLQVLDNVVNSDRRWLLVATQTFGSYGHVAFDIDGPW